MRIPYMAYVAAIALAAATAGAAAQSKPPESAQQNVRESQQYEQLLCSNPAFRQKRIAQECGPITDPQLHQNCLASFECGAAPRRGRNRPPPSETIR